jgi:hypothetical protein
MGTFLNPKSPPTVEKLSWEETSRQMAENREDRRAWDTAANDGLAEIPWQRKTGRKDGRTLSRTASSLRRLITEMYGE